MGKCFGKERPMANVQWQLGRRQEGNLSTVATVLASITFAAAINPPGRVIQQGIRPSDPNFNLTSSSNTTLSRGPMGCWNYKDGIGDTGSAVGACPGKAMLAYRDVDNLASFIIYNTICFVASMIVALLLVSGVPLKDIIVMRVLSLGMNIAGTCLPNAYFSGLILIAPYTLFIHDVVTVTTTIFNTLQALVGAYIFLTSLRWARTKKVMEKLTKHRNSSDQGTRAGTSNARYV